MDKATTAGNRDNTHLFTALTGFSVLVFSMGIGRFAFTPILPLMQAEKLLDINSGGLIASIHFLGYAMGALLAGLRPLPPKFTLVASLALIGAATGAMGFGESNIFWALMRWVAGVTSALALVVVGTHCVKRLAETQHAELQGWVFAGVGGGTALVGLAMLVLMPLPVPSRSIWHFFGFATLAAATVIWLLLGTDRNEVEPLEVKEGHGLMYLNWAIIVPYGAMGLGYIIPATYLPVMAQQEISSPLVFGWCWPLFGLAAAISTIVSAKLHTRFSNRKVWIVSQLVMTFGLVVPAVWPDISTVIFGGVCVGGTFMVITMAGLKEAHRFASAGGVQYQIAAMTTAFAIGQIVGPVLAGWTYSASHGFAFPLLLAAGILVFTMLPLFPTKLGSSEKE